MSGKPYSQRLDIFFHTTIVTAFGCVSTASVPWCPSPKYGTNNKVIMYKIHIWP
jgi:hypothetical protein